MSMNSYNEYLHRYGEVKVGSNCLKCGEFFATEYNRTRMYCHSCNLKVHGRRDDKNEPIIRLINCRMCGKEIVYYNFLQGFKILDEDKNGNHGKRFCGHCSKVHSKIWYKDYHNTFKQNIREYGRNYWFKTKIYNGCTDCGNLINIGGTRCKECAHDRNSEKKRVNAKKYYRKMRWFIKSRNANTIGTIVTKKDFSLIRKDDGTPDFDDEFDEIQEIKMKTYKRGRMYGIISSDYRRFNRIEMDKFMDEMGK